MPADERPDTMQEWDCDQIKNFDMLAQYFTIEGYIVKGIQMAIFSYIILVIIYQRCKGRKQIGPISILIAVLSLLNSVFSMIRINTLFPFYANNVLLSLIFSFENICFFGATWLFGIKYYETAIDFEQIIVGDSAYLYTYESIVKTVGRKRKFNYLRWSMFAFIIVLSVFQGVSIFNDETVQAIADISSFALLTLVVMGTSIAMIAAFMKFYRIVSSTQEKPDFNRLYIAIQIAGLSIWLIAWTLGGIFLLIYGGDFNDYYLDRNLIFCVSISFTSTMLNFLIIALVIYKSSIAAGNDDTENDRH